MFYCLTVVQCKMLRILLKYQQNLVLLFTFTRYVNGRTDSRTDSRPGVRPNNIKPRLLLAAETQKKAAVYTSVNGDMQSIAHSVKTYFYGAISPTRIVGYASSSSRTTRNNRSVFSVCRRRSRPCRRWGYSSVHWRQSCSADHTATQTIGHSSIDITWHTAALKFCSRLASRWNSWMMMMIKMCKRGQMS